MSESKTKTKIVYQTRSDDHSGLRYFKTFQDAYAAFVKDPTIWKISFADQRWVTKRAFEEWSTVSEKKLKEMYKPYADGKSTLYWVHQLVMPPNYETFWKDKLPLDRNSALEDQYYSEMIVEILTDEEFQKRFSK